MTSTSTIPTLPLDKNVNNYLQPTKESLDKALQYIQKHIHMSSRNILILKDINLRTIIKIFSTRTDLPPISSNTKKKQELNH